MKNRIIVSTITGIMLTGHAYAAVSRLCMPVGCGNSLSNDEVEVVTRCPVDGTTTATCLQGPSGTIYRIKTCNSCTNGTSPTSISVGELLSNTPLAEGDDSCKNSTLLIQTCCMSCNNCTDDTDFTASGVAGYERKATRSCSCLTGCSASYTYRCAAGYYGAPLTGTSGCTQCPTSSGATSAAGSTKITSCYIPSGTNFSDTIGSGTYTSDCYYTN